MDGSSPRADPVRSPRPVDTLGDYDVTIATDTHVRSRADIPDADIVMPDPDSEQVLAIYGDELPGRVARALPQLPCRFGGVQGRFRDRRRRPVDQSRQPQSRHGPSRRDLRGDRGDRTRPDCRHLVDNLFVLVGQQYLADPSRSSGSINPLWTYAHVPPGFDGDATELVIRQIERFAPGSATSSCTSGR